MAKLKKRRLLPELSADVALTIFRWSYLGLIIGSLLAFLSTMVSFWSDNAIKYHDNIRLSENERETKRAIAESDKANAALGVAQADIAKAQATAAIANAESARLRLELQREIQKRSPRQLTEFQKSTLTESLLGKLERVTFVVQQDLEARYFALQLQIAIQNAGAKIFLSELPAGELLTPAPGVIMYAPYKQSQQELEDDPLYLALKKADLFGGLTSQPYASFQPNPTLSGLLPMIPNGGHVIYVAQKPPW